MSELRCLVAVLVVVVPLYYPAASNLHPVQKQGTPLGPSGSERAECEGAEVSVLGGKGYHRVLCVRNIPELEEEGRRKHRAREASAQVLLHSRQQQFVQDHTECWVLS